MKGHTLPQRMIYLVQLVALGILILACNFSSSALDSAGTPQESPTASLEGRYKVAGVNPDGSTYTGEAGIQQVGDQYQITWEIGELIYTGSGILEGMTLSVTWRQAEVEGFALYNLEEGGLLTGTWLVTGFDEPGTETLTPLE